jgi:hypothetical protein
VPLALERHHPPARRTAHGLSQGSLHGQSGVSGSLESSEGQNHAGATRGGLPSRKHSRRRLTCCWLRQERCRRAATFKTEAAQDFLRDGVRNILGSIGLWVEPSHAQRIAMLPAHQIGDGGFKVRAVEIGLCELGAEPAIMIDAMRARANSTRSSYNMASRPLG